MNDRNWRLCPQCKGIGVKDGGRYPEEDQCETCGGLGRIAINKSAQASVEHDIETKLRSNNKESNKENKNEMAQ